MRVLLLLLLASSAQAYEILQNDSAAPGEEIAFYPRLQSEESFRVILDGPAWPTYRICSLLLWVGPEDFTVFEVRIGEANEAGGEAALIWQPDDDAYQVMGSRNALNSIDLRHLRIVTDARRLRVRFSHAPGFAAPPTIASDTDGITPRRNQLSFLMRNGDQFDDFTETLPEDGLNPRPPGDWIVRVVVAEEDEACPVADDPPGPVLDAGINDPDAAPPRDATPPPRDAGPPPDAGQQDASPPQADAHVRRDAAAALDAGREDAETPDIGVIVRGDGPLDATRPGSDRGLDIFAIDRISPTAGAPDRNVDVVVNGRGFPFGEDVLAYLGDTRLLEARVLSESTLTAIVPAGIAPGVYALRIERTDGQAAILPEAYAVIGPALGTPAEDGCGCNLAANDPPVVALSLIFLGLCRRRLRGTRPAPPAPAHPAPPAPPAA